MPAQVIRFPRKRRRPSAKTEPKGAPVDTVPIYRPGDVVYFYLYGKEFFGEVQDCHRDDEPALVRVAVHLGVPPAMLTRIERGARKGRTK
jgi:hypothetical protein